MNILRNILSVIVGAFIGGFVNMGLIMSSDSIISLPEGIEPGNMDSLAANMHLFEPVNFIMPFLAHALGTLVGAFLAAKIAATYKLRFALAIGVLFLIGGVQMAMALPSPLWFDGIDVVLAYIPMAWLGWKLAESKS